MVSSATKFLNAVDHWRMRRLLARTGGGKAETNPHSGGRSLQDHLLAVYSILKAWDQPKEVCLAGLFHSVYSTDVYRRETILPRDADLVRSAIGAPAERLVSFFSVMDRRAFLTVTRTLRLGEIREPLPLPLRGDAVHGAQTAISPRQWQQLVILHCANAIEQLGRNDGSPALGWGGWGDVLRCLDPALSVLPPVCSLLNRLPDRRDEEQVALRYAKAVREFGSAESHAALEAIAAGKPVFAEPLVWLSARLAVEGDVQRSATLATEALQLTQLWATAWDKRLPWSTWVSLAQALRRGRPLAQAPLPLERLRERALAAPSAGATSEETRGALRLARYLRNVYRAKRPAETGHYPALPRNEVLSNELFPIVAMLEANFPAIRAELLAVAGEHFIEEQEPIERTGHWTVFMLYEAGRKVDQHCALCPILTGLLDQSADITGANAMIYLSRLAPGTEVAPHRGPTNTRVRCHLGIKVPDGDCGMRVGGTRLAWQEGRCLVFDDSIEHEVWNRTAAPRIVLLVDLWHPSLLPVERDGLAAVSWMVEQRARRLHRYRLKNLQASLAAQGSSPAESIPLPAGQN